MPKVKKKKLASKVKKKPVAKVKKKTASKLKKSVKKKTAKRKSKVLAIPKGYTSITPYLIVDNGNKAIDFYKKVFGAKEVMRMEQKDGKIGHAELKIGDSKIMLADPCPAMGAHSPDRTNGSPVGIHLYVKNVDEVFRLATNAGAVVVQAVDNKFYGDRSGSVKCPFGHTWYIATHVEDVTPAQMRKRAAELFS